MNAFSRSFKLGARLLAAAILIFSALVIHAESVASLPKPTDYVSDFAHVLSPAAIARIDSVFAASWTTLRRMRRLRW